MLIKEATGFHSSRELARAYRQRTFLLSIYTMFSHVFQSKEKVTGGMLAVEGFVWVYWD